jgi:hypothetical protein
MIYSVVPRELEPQLLEQLTAHYAESAGCEGDRRSPHGRAPDASRRHAAGRRGVISASCAIVDAGEPAETSPRCAAKDR